MPYRDVLTPLMQRLVRLVGSPVALQLAHSIPKLAVDADGTVLDYDHDDPRTTARLLLEQYEAAFAIATSLTQQSSRAAAAVPSANIEQEAASIRILVVDDHVLVREGLVSLIEPQPDLHVVGQAGSVREAIALSLHLRPEVIVMDFSLPDGTGDEAARAILEALPDTKIVFLTVHDDDERLFAAIAAGAVGYLLKSVRSAELLQRLRGLTQGEVAFSPTMERRILEAVARRPPPRRVEVAVHDALTEREVAILRLIVQGNTNRQIADTLMLSVRTVEYHRANVTSKLGLHSRADLVQYAATHGLLEPQAEHKLLASQEIGHAPGSERRGKR